MNRTPIPAILEPYPVNLRPYLLDAPIYDSSCSERVHVYFVERDGGYFLKVAPAETLFTEAEMTNYFHEKGLAPAVVFCNSCYEGYDYLLTASLLGEDWSFSGFIDLDHAGIGDRHIDLYWGAWSLCYNLGTDAYRDTFYDAYGRDLIDPERIRTVAACECFG